MGTGIVVCGLNGAGKSTLGRVLAEKLNFCFIDAEDLFFPKTDPNYLYASPRTHREADALLFDQIQAHEDFVFAAVKGDYGADVLPFFHWIVVLEVPKEIRMRRLWDRSFRKFGERMLPGGDLCGQEQAFFTSAAARTERSVEEWAQSLSCPVIHADGTKPAEETTNEIIRRIQA